MILLSPRLLRIVRFLVPFLVAAFICGEAKGTIRYKVSLAHPEQHLFHVKMEIPDVSGEVRVQIPAWNALYQIRDFSAHVQQVEASIGDQSVPIEKLDKLTWHITGSGTITIRYATYWDEAGPFGTQLNSEHAFINSAIILMYVPERRAEGVQLDLNSIPASWLFAGALMLPDESMGGARIVSVTAPNYDALVDAPLEGGKFEEFRVAGIEPPISVVVHGDDWKKKRVEEDLRRICTYETKLMESVPYKRYTFIVHVGKGTGGAGGGMEHADSTAISVRSEEDLPNVAAHEFFHLWNVKRIRPASLDPVDYTKEQYTRALWFAEGVTSTYAAYTLVRTGLWSKERFYADLGEQITELEERPANKWQSAEQSGLDAWLEKYALYRRPQNSVSYYTKGQVLGVLLDILIRDRTDNEKSLDDVLRAMNADFAKHDKPYRDSLDIRLTAEKVAGGSFADFFSRFVAGAEHLPYEQALRQAGLGLRTSDRKRATLGFSAERDANGALIVRSVDPEGAAAPAGLRAGDAVLSWNGADAPRNPERWVYSQKPGNTLKLKVRRDEREQTVEFRLGEVSETFYAVVEDSHASEKARHIREGLLKGVTQPVTVFSR